ncbi:MAG: hypothetical protein UV48_C0012G0022 [Candidatus Azambacteria bacterium GW2011_GWA2_42_9]|uniref:Uncharacterized protein n=1 Tax=Candidatus Azambacteria bacterium GW2011_GWA2_42_9 TaxID=1618613 RepID=A0A0G1BPW4_9BACT|nr:MAG: hypothetical protein UV48_C0012G0022 [Candidatus Azambacteria bacterium GW2011_GWA2_42_9]KKS88101.1 MAG: hypothetical protein UV62_C0015G0022 [Parcubacteria group bacterium GW2011_GWC1_43_11]
METERKFNLKPKEQAQHEEVLRRQRIFHGLEGEEARRLLEQELNRLTPEEQEVAWQKIKGKE